MRDVVSDRSAVDIEAAIAALAARCSTCRMVAAEDVAVALRECALTADELRRLHRALQDHGLSVVGGDIEAHVALRNGRTGR